MSPVSNHIVEAQLRWRYATKLFDSTKTISPEDWRTLENALVLTPSSFGLQPWKFIVITDRAIRERLKPATYNQSQVVDASHVVVFAIRKNLSVEDIDRYVSLTAEVRGTDIEKLTGFRTSMIRTLHDPQFDVDEWAARQVYIALGFFMASAAIMGIDTCPIEGFVPEKYDDILGLNDQGFGSCVVAAAGYRAGTDRYAQVPKVRFRNEDVIHRI